MASRLHSRQQSPLPGVSPAPPSSGPSTAPTGHHWYAEEQQRLDKLGPEGEVAAGEEAEAAGLAPGSSAGGGYHPHRLEDRFAAAEAEKPLSPQQGEGVEEVPSEAAVGLEADGVEGAPPAAEEGWEVGPELGAEEVAAPAPSPAVAEEAWGGEESWEGAEAVAAADEWGLQPQPEEELPEAAAEAPAAGEGWGGEASEEWGLPHVPEVPQPPAAEVAWGAAAGDGEQWGRPQIPAAEGWGGEAVDGEEWAAQQPHRQLEQQQVLEAAAAYETGSAAAVCLPDGSQPTSLDAEAAPLSPAASPAAPAAAAAAPTDGQLAELQQQLAALAEQAAAAEARAEAAEVAAAALEAERDQLLAEQQEKDAVVSEIQEVRAGWGGAVVGVCVCVLGGQVKPTGKEGVVRSSSRRRMLCG